MVNLDPNKGPLTASAEKSDYFGGPGQGIFQPVPQVNTFGPFFPPDLGLAPLDFIQPRLNNGPVPVPQMISQPRLTPNKTQEQARRELNQSNTDVLLIVLIIAGIGYSVWKLNGGV